MFLVERRISLFWIVPASDEFSGHCLALTLLGSYLTDAYNGDIRCRKEVSVHLADDVRQGAHARKVMHLRRKFVTSE
jgi:hypothetical protein